MARRRGAAEVVVKARRTTTSAVMPSLDHHAWRMLKRKHKAYSKIQHSPCWLHAYGMCLYHGEPIDYTASHSTPMAYEADHKQTRQDRPDLWLEWNNIGATHVRCNRSRQAKVVVPQGVWIRPKF